MIDFYIIKMIKMLLMFLVSLVVCLVIEMTVSGCTRSVYIPVESVKHDTLRQLQISKDTLIYSDSVYVKESGDTIYYYRWKVKYKSVVRVDTVYIAKCDTIMKPYNVIEKKEEIPKSKWGVVFVLVIVVVGISGYVRYKC